MLIVREGQMAALRDAAERLFEQEMHVYLGGFNAPSLAGLDDRLLRTAVRYGIVQARQQRFTLRGPIRLYLETMVILGHRFHDDPQYPKITAIMADPEGGAEMDRAQALFDGIMNYREKAVGRNEQYLHAALERLRSIAINSVMLNRNSDALADMLCYVYPQKAETMGIDGLRALVCQGLAWIRDLGLTQAQDARLVCTLTMIFGHSCFDDPFVPWIGQALADSKRLAPADPRSIPGRSLQEQTQARVTEMLVAFNRTAVRES